MKFIQVFNVLLMASLLFASTHCETNQRPGSKNYKAKDHVKDVNVKLNTSGHIVVQSSSRRHKFQGTRTDYLSALSGPASWLKDDSAAALNAWRPEENTSVVHEKSQRLGDLYVGSNPKKHPKSDHQLAMTYIRNKHQRIPLTNRSRDGTVSRSAREVQWTLMLPPWSRSNTDLVDLPEGHLHSQEESVSHIYEPGPNSTGGHFCHGMSHLLYGSSKYFSTETVPLYGGDDQLFSSIVIENRTHCARKSALPVHVPTILNVTVETCCITWCTHVIEVEVRENEHILLNFLKFNVPGLNLARSDTVGICDESLEVQVEHRPHGSAEVKSHVLGSFCGIKAPTSVFAESHKTKLVLRLQDNAQCVDKINFSVQIVPCLKFPYKSCNSLDYVSINDDHGYISSPGLSEGQNYPNDIECTWNISVSEDKLIRLVAEQIRLRPGDVIEIYPNMSHSRPFPTILRFSDHDFRQPVVLPSSDCRIVFNSDSIKSGVGFNISYTAVDVSMFIPMFPNNSLDCSYDQEIPETMKCDFYLDCANGEDEKNCEYKQPGCWPQGYALDGHCYQAVLNQPGMSWTMAEEFCERKLASHLVAITTVAERRFLDKLRQFLGPSLAVMFLGLQRMRMQQVSQLYRRMWQWTDGSTAFYLPDEYRSEGWSTCSLFHRDYFHSTECDAILNNVSFICERTMYDRNGVDIGQVAPSHYQEDLLIFDTRISLFHCHSGEYISLEQRCDHVETCFDRSDELDCNYEPLEDVMFSCDSGGLLPYSFVCDGVYGCLDSSDEKWCRLPDKATLGLVMTVCTDGMFLERSRVCDGMEDCRDASDEEDCTSCVRGSALCPMIACLPEEWITDDEIDCPIRDLKGRRAPESQFRENVFKTIPPPAIVVPDGYGKFELKPKVESEPCPSTHRECVDGYCIPVYMWCNGMVDCPHGEDENLELCEHVCVGKYKCLHSRVCVHEEHLCDGYYQCPDHDDETLCGMRNVACPEHCSCTRMEVTCTAYPRFTSLTPVRYLRLREANVPDLYIENVPAHSLIYLNVSSCHVRHIREHNFKFLNLRILDVSHNSIESIHADTFKHCPALKVLILSNNLMVNANFSFLIHTRELTKLDLSYNIKAELEDDCFHKAVNLEELIMRHMNIVKISPNAFNGLFGLKRLDLQDNEILYFSSDIFHSQKNLRRLVTDNFRLCCPSIKPISLQHQDCLAPHDEISSCADILRTYFLRVALWLMAVLTITGNVAVIVYRIFYDRGIKYSFRIIITCLSASDLIMGVYLVIIGTADVIYRDRYLLAEREWKSSAPCQVAGFLCVLSSETSALFILLVTVDRLLAIAFPLHPALHFNGKSATLACLFVWSVGLAIASVPLLPPFHHWDLYSHRAVGVPLPISRSFFPGYDYAFAIFIVFNMIVFVLVALGQLFIYLSVRLQKHPQISQARVMQDTAIAKRLVLVVITDCLCWFPITVMGVAARTGQPVPGEMYLVATVFLLPANSALNPFLYTANAILLARRNRRRKKKSSGVNQELLPTS